MSATRDQPDTPTARHAPVRPDWLALWHEDPIDPDLPIVDAHHHLWERETDRYLAVDMVADIAASGHRIVATVFVEGRRHWLPDGDVAFRPVGETAMAVAEAGGPHRIAAGIVAYADLTLGAAVGAVLDCHAGAAAGRLRGIRLPSVWHPDPAARGSSVSAPPGLLGSPSFRAGLAELAGRGLVYDAWMYHTQLHELADLAAAMPGLQIVLDHAGGPLGIGPYAVRRDAVFADWRKAMRTLARHPNVAVKLGGFGMPMSGFGFATAARPPASAALAAAWGPWFREAVEVFGAERCMVESNFPVDKGSAAYGAVWNAMKRIFGDAAPHERRALFAGTADAVYRLALGLKG
jgi:predicted TIM-barrel fold metal-dependent hydrolase